MSLQILKHNPKSIERETRILRRLGLNEQDIAYLTWLKSKEQLGIKRHNKH